MKINILIELTNDKCSMTIIDDNKKEIPVQLQSSRNEYPYSIIIDKNEIQIGNEQSELEINNYQFRNTEFMNNIINKITINKNQSDYYSVNYNSKEYQLTNDSLAILYFYQFKKWIEKKGIINQTIINIKSINSIKSIYPIIRLYYCFNTVGFVNISFQSSISHHLQFSEEMISDQIDDLIEILEYHENYLKFKYRIEQIQRIMKERNDTTHPTLLQLNPNDEYSENKMKEIQSQLTTKERSLYHLCQLDYYTIFISSRYFNSFDDYVNLELSSKRLLGNMTKFHYTVLETTRKP